MTLFADMKSALVIVCVSALSLATATPVTLAQPARPNREEAAQRQADEHKQAEENRKERQRHLDEERAAREERAAEERRQRKQRREDEDRQRREAAAAEREKDEADRAAYRADLAKFKSDSCEDIANLVARASRPGLALVTVELYKLEIHKRRTGRRIDLQQRIRNGMTTIRCESADEVAQARAGIAQVKADLEDLRCHGASAAEALDPQVEAWIPQREAAIADDEKCLAQKGCMTKRIAQRIADELCPALERRAEVSAEISRIRKYGREVGVVNMQDLYDLGEELKTLDEEIAAGKSRYARVTKRTFTRAACAAR